jgi:hypothetical protein
VATFAVWHVGDILAATEAAAQKIIDESRLLVGGEMGEQLAFEPALKIGARLRSCYVELWEMLSLLAHHPSFSRACARPAKCRSRS